MQDPSCLLPLGTGAPFQERCRQCRQSSIASRNDRVWGGVGLGGTYSWDDDKYSIYGEGLVQTSLNDFGDSYSVKVQVGLRMKW